MELNNDIIHQAFKTPPHSIVAEQSVIGSLFIRNDKIDLVTNIIQDSEWFYRRDNRIIYEAMLALATTNQPFDPVTVQEYLAKQELLEEAGGKEYFSTLFRDTPSAANVKAYANIVRRNGILRNLIKAGEEISGEAYDAGDTPIDTIIDKAQSEILKLNTTSNLGEPKHVGTYMSGVIADIDRFASTETIVTGMPTGIGTLDKVTLGMQNSNLYVVAGRPSMGKTVLALNIAEHNAVELGNPVLVFSLEMSGADLSMRSLSSVGKVSYWAMRQGKLTDEDYSHVTEGLAKINNSQLHIDETPGLNINQLCARARMMKKKHGIKMVVIDYLQLMTPTPHMYRATKTEQVAEISRGLKLLSKELNIPVVVISQLNRDCERRPDKRPIMSDLRDSGAIEQDADVIIFMYRDVIYNKDTREPQAAELIFAKYRNGVTQTCYLMSKLSNMRFKSWVGEPPNYGNPKNGFNESRDLN